jgi:hypothetical protein
MDQTGFLDRGGGKGHPKLPSKSLNLTLKVLAWDKFDSL